MGNRPSNEETCHARLRDLLIPSRGAAAEPLTTRLIDEFGSLGALLAASPERQLSAAAGDALAVAVLQAAGAVVSHVNTLELAARPVLPNSEALLRYLGAELRHQPTEVIRVMHLNRRNVLLRDEVMGRGTIDEAPCYVREVIRRAVELHSAALILAHNHPSGDPEPSRADIALTTAIVNAGRPLGIEVAEHLIFGSFGHTSMRRKALIPW